jgi:predicted Co/Zn/Cd cation transporter (cation efflux family)
VSAPPASREQSALRLSLATGVAIAVIAVAWGLLANSQVILFDGAYALIGMALTGLSMAASRVVATGPTARFPFGLEALTPVVIGVQGLALLGTIAYASLEAVRVILDGGSEVATVAVAGYGAVTAVVSLAVVRRMRTADPASDLLEAEARAWWAGFVLSTVVVAGSLAAVALRAAGLTGVERFVDPVLVLVASAILVATPLGMLRSTLVELLEGAPRPEVLDPVTRAVAQVREEFDLPEPITRVSKVGRKLYVEVDFVVDEGAWDVAGEDRVRRAVDAGLRRLPYDVWLTVELTADPALAT